MDLILSHGLNESAMNVASVSAEVSLFCSARPISYFLYRLHGSCLGVRSCETTADEKEDITVSGIL